MTAEAADLGPACICSSRKRTTAHTFAASGALAHRTEAPAPTLLICFQLPLPKWRSPSRNCRCSCADQGSPACPAGTVREVSVAGGRADEAAPARQMAPPPPETRPPGLAPLEQLGQARPWRKQATASGEGPEGLS